MQPVKADMHIDTFLTSVSLAYKNESIMYDKACPIIQVRKDSDKIVVMDRKYFAKNAAQLRAPGQESVGGGYVPSSVTYTLENFAFHKMVPDEDLDNADSPLDPYLDATAFVSEVMAVKKELTVVSSCFTTSIWGTDNTTATNWDLYATATPLTDVDTAATQIMKDRGVSRRNLHLMVGHNVHDALKRSPSITALWSGVAPELISEDMLRQAFDIGGYTVASASYNTAVEGATAADSFTHGKNALLCHTAPNPGILVPSAGYIFSWSGVSDGLGMSVGTSRIEMPLKKAVRVEGEIAFDDMVVASDLGYFFSGAVI